MLLDLHVETALQQGYKLFRDNQAAFDYIFPGVDAALLAQWWQAFKDSPPTIGSSFKRGTDKLPLLLVTPNSDDPGERPMGDVIFKDTDNRFVGGEILKLTVTIRIVAQSPMLMRIWYNVLYHVLFSAMPDFVKAGYNDLYRESADDFSSDEEELGEQYGLAGVTTRSVRLHATWETQVKYWDKTYGAKGWYTLASDQQTLDGKPGGVIP